jgi:branched-chain amino acid transport system ATP-binding protein
VLRDIDFRVPPSSVVALLGANGAGKTTLLRAASGLLRPSKGKVLLDGKDVTRRASHDRARGGLCLVPDGRGVFPSLSVRDNLQLQVPPWDKGGRIDEAFDIFPVLKERLKQTAGTMSGGQQQMLALARCFLAKPKVVLLDEVSMGLAPRVVEEIFQAVRRLASTGVAILLVEQYVTTALELADSVSVMSRGRISFTGSPDQVDHDALINHYISA